MYISWNWLNRHVDLSGLDPIEVGYRFTMSVAELEGIEQFGETYDRVVAAKVLDIRPHPNSDRLTVLALDLGDQRLEAVSGAPNIEKGSLIAFALPGVKLEGVADKPVVAETEVRGVNSPGVTCSERELGISDDHTRLMTFPEGSSPGTLLTDALPVHDYILEVDNKSITHRPDLWGHYGIAREVAALVERELKPFDITIPEGDEDPLQVTVEAPDSCPRYTALVFDGVTIEPSPTWMKLALAAVGVRPVNNVVDITNYVMLDVGNPTHAFDARFIGNDAIVVRQAADDEVLTTLDGEPRSLIPDDVVIADGDGGVALGGVMGGENSEIKDDTTRVVLEAACFNPPTIRRTSSRLGLRTEASARFEKGLDRESPIQATALFARLLQQLCPSAAPVSRFYDVSAPAPETTIVTISHGYLCQRLGTTIPAERVVEMLEALEFRVDRKGDDFVITVPTFRATRDISIPEDIVEEIGRIHGYDNIAPVSLLAPVRPVPLVPSKQLERRARRALVGQGYFEAMCYSFDSLALAESIDYSLEGAVQLANPISSDMPALRGSLIPNLLMALGKNTAREEVRLFEVARVFHPLAHDESVATKDRIPQQERHVGGVAYVRKGDGLDLFRTVKGHVEALGRSLARGDVRFGHCEHTEGKPWLVEAKTLSIFIGDVECGVLSVLNPLVRDRLKLKGKASLFEIDLEPFVATADAVETFKPLARFPAIQNDLSVIVDVSVSNEKVVSVITDAGGPLLDELEMFAVFRGGPIPEGQKSLSYHLRFRSAERTLKDKEVEPLMEGILAALRTTVGGDIRV